MKSITMKRNSLLVGAFVALLALLVSFNQAKAQSVSISSTTSNGVYKYQAKRGSQKLNIEYEGEIEIADDDRSIESISRGGYLLIRKTSFGERREVLAEPSSEGVKYEYRVGRRVREWNKEAEEFLADVLMEVIQTTGIGAESRVARYYKKGGTDAVLDEVEEIRNDHVKHIYLQILLDEYELKDAELVKLAAFVPKELDSDHYITEVFKDHSEKFLKNDQTTEAFLGAIKRMDSDHYISVILNKALREDLNNESLKIVIGAADVMNSDHYKTNVLKEVLDRRDLDDEIIDAVVKASGDINSDHYATIIISDALDRENLSDEAFNSLVEAVGNLDSDHYITQTFKSMLHGREVSDKVIVTVIDKLDYMDSDHYRNVIIDELLDDRKISSAYFDELLKVIDEVGSDHYKTQMLAKALKSDLTDAQYEMVLKSIGDIDSDHYKVKMIKDMIRRDMSDAQLKSILNLADYIDSDYYKTEVLREACSQVRTAGDDVKELFKKVSRGIDSDTYYGRVARCID